MSSFAIGYGSLTETSTLSGGDWAAEFPLSNLKLWPLASVAQSTSLDTADTRFDMDHGTAKAAQVLWIPCHNLSATAQIAVHRGTTLGGLDVYSGDYLDVWAFEPLDGVDGSAFGAFVVMPTANSARYTRVYISDAANPDGYVQISRPFLGPIFQPWINPVQLTDDWISLSAVERTEFGADWVVKRPPLRSRGLVYKGLTYAEGALLKEIIRTHDTTSELVYLPSLVDRELIQQDGFLALFRELGRLEYLFWKHNGIALAFDERGGAP